MKASPQAIVALVALSLTAPSHHYFCDAFIPSSTESSMTGRSVIGASHSYSPSAKMMDLRTLVASVPPLMIQSQIQSQSNRRVAPSSSRLYNFVDQGFGGKDDDDEEDEDEDSDIDKSSKTVIIAGASGYIGKSTVRESVRQGYNTIALVRDISKVNNAQGKAMYGQYFEGAKVVECDVCDPSTLTKTLAQLSKDNNGIEAITSCLASRSGIKKDAYAIDYQATLNCLESGRDESVKVCFFII